MPSASPVSNARPVRKSLPGRRVVPLPIGGVEAKEDFYGNALKVIDFVCSNHVLVSHIFLSTCLFAFFYLQ
jgi:hypothetical protein